MTGFSTSRAIVLAVLAATGLIGLPGMEGAETMRPHVWGNTTYVDLAVGESADFLGKSVKLMAVRNDRCVVSVNGVEATLAVARRGLPVTIEGVRVFAADNRPVAELTTDEDSPLLHAAMTRDALLGLSDPEKPLLDPERFTFPVSRADGFVWTMRENSHMFAFLRAARAHQGIDMDLTDARGRKRHAIVAVEDGTVRWVAGGNENEACVLLESASYPGVYYIYQHLNRHQVEVAAGQHVLRGQRLGYIWGDGRWAHLHFAVAGCGEAPDYTGRYRDLLNCFPQLYELWHGGGREPSVAHTAGHFTFAGFYFADGNVQRLGAFSEVLGYGWNLGDWSTAAKVDRSVPGDEGMAPHQSAVVRKIMQADTPHPAVNPHDYGEFEIAVPKGRYQIRACVGDHYGPSWQEVTFEDEAAGVYDLPDGEWAWTPAKTVQVDDGRLTVRLRFGDDSNAAALRELYFVLAEPGTDAPAASSEPNRSE